MVEFKVFRGSKSGIKESTTSKTIGPHDVLVQVTHSGLCGTDMHYKELDMVLGHEGAGVVKELGSEATLFKKGDRVGWGYLHSSCGHCKQCLTGTETLCPERKLYGKANLEQGSMGEAAVWDENFLFAIPDKIASQDAAPLMCGGKHPQLLFSPPYVTYISLGATVFNALQMYGVKSTDRVGIIGVGGLGHLAIQFAAKMGCEVVVFSGTDSKKDEATKLGAGEFYATKDVKELKISKPIDHLLVTTSAQPDWNLYLSVLAPGATIYPLSVSKGNLSLPYMPIVNQSLRIQGSLVAARQIHREMLEFAAYHDIKPVVQTFSLDKVGIDEAFKRLEDGKMRYRGVLVA
jgi:D-arabinose 1-dehydrogenase-like Zn-dependent alcohol dehydrogenase